MRLQRGANLLHGVRWAQTRSGVYGDSGDGVRGGVEAKLSGKFRPKPNINCHQPNAAGHNSFSLSGLLAGLSASIVYKMSHSYFQVYSPAMFPASSPFYTEPESSTKECLQEESVFVEQREKFAHPSCWACVGILINPS